MLNHDATFDFGSTKMCSPAIFETYFSDHKDVRISVIVYYIIMYFY